jgi:aspartyl-tRNA(Asn)/glutamyl-tRNA(Gln) amidotransferase subunit C
MKKNIPTLDQAQVKHIAKLANIPVSDVEAQGFTTAFDETLEMVSRLQTVNTTDVEPTYQVTGLENIFRDDRVEEETMFSQEQALANASQVYQGYFVIPRVIDEDAE